MGSSWLTANYVEEIHKAHLKGRATAQHVAKLSEATLAGLVEYGCLRRAIPDLPALPDAVTQSPLGRQLLAIDINGPDTNSIPISLSHEPRVMEFVVVRDEDDLLSEPMEMLFMRVTQAAKQAGFSVSTANQFQAAMNEMLSNAVEHSSSPTPILAGYHVRPNIASFIVADMGRGVFDTLRENADHKDVADHCQAIRKALRDGVSRFRDTRGNGFRPIFQALLENWGILRFRSRKGCLTMNGTGLDASQGINHFPPELPGFQVAVTCQATGYQPDFPVV
jgi:hypothetical protein